jgi:hypothetical protein
MTDLSGHNLYTTCTQPVHTVAPSAADAVPGVGKGPLLGLAAVVLGLASASAAPVTAQADEVPALEHAVDRAILCANTIMHRAPSRVFEAAEAIRGALYGGEGESFDEAMGWTYGAPGAEGGEVPTIELLAVEPTGGGRNVARCAAWLTTLPAAERQQAIDWFVHVLRESDATIALDDFEVTQTLTANGRRALGQMTLCGGPGIAEGARDDTLPLRIRVNYDENGVPFVIRFNDAPLSNREGTCDAF